MKRFSYIDYDFIFDGYDGMFVAGHMVAFPYFVSTNFKTNLAAAMAASSGGYKSIDYVKKTFGDHWGIEDGVLEPEVEILLEISNCIKYYTRDAIKRIQDLDGRLPGSFGLYVAGAAFKRLESTFKLARLCLFKGFQFESMCMAKLILEQSTWAYAVHNLPDEEVNSIQPTKTVSNFKKINPTVGELYGEINEKAHISTKKIVEILEFGTEGKDTRIKLYDYERSLECGMALMQVTDVFGASLEIVYKDYLQEFKFINSAENPIVRKGREISEDFEIIKKKIINLLEERGKE